MRTRTARLSALIAVMIFLLVSALPAFAQNVNIKETNLIGWNGYFWQKVGKGDILESKMVYQEDFLCYTNSTTGVVVLAGASAPDNSNILTPVDFYWGTTLTNGTVKLKAAANGTMVIDTGHGAQNDMASVAWREADFAIAKNPRIEALVKVSSLTNCWYEVGWYVDANDEILFRFKASVDATHWQIVYEKNNGGEQTYDTGVAASADTYTHLRIDLLSTGGAKCYINAVLVKTYAASTIRDVAFKPFFYAAVTDAAHAATKTMTVDFVRLTQDR